jgi:Glycosyl transferase family 2
MSSSATGYSAPLVSVVVSTFDGASLIEGCIDLLERQTIFDQLEIIVVDSGSSQDEDAAIKRRQARYPNIIYVRTRRETIYAAWNRGLALASGKYFANFNVDDWVRADALELFARALEANSESSLAYSNWGTTYVPQSSPIESPSVLAIHQPYMPAFPLFFCFSGCVQFWRKSCLQALGGFDASFHACGDLDILCRFAASGGVAVFVPEMLEGYFSNPNGVSQASGRSLVEQQSIFRRARDEAEIGKLFQIDESDPASVAGAWTCLGNLALTIRVPWHAGALLDYAFSLDCYSRALDEFEGYGPAVCNRLMVIDAMGRGSGAASPDATLDVGVTNHAPGLENLVRPGVQPLVVGPVFGLELSNEDAKR